MNTFSAILEFCTRIEQCIDSSGELFIRAREGRTRRDGNKHQSPWTVPHGSTCIISSLTRHNKSINDDENDDLQTSTPCLTHSIYVLLVITIEWSHHDDQTIVTRARKKWYLSDIDFIHGDIYGRSCQKLRSLLYLNGLVTMYLTISSRNHCANTVLTARQPRKVWTNISHESTNILPQRNQITAKNPIHCVRDIVGIANGQSIQFIQPRQHDLTIPQIRSKSGYNNYHT